MAKYINVRSLIVFILLLSIIIYRRCSNAQNEKVDLKYIHGTTMGGILYNIKFIGESPQGIDDSIKSLLRQFNAALSTYQSDSEISRFNTTSSHTFESPYFYPVLSASRRIYTLTQGAFDPTVGSLVNTWGFGKSKDVFPDSTLIDSLLLDVGFDYVDFDSLSVSKSRKSVMIDFSAIAKGYAVDLVAALLNEGGIGRYMVEIGGEIRCQGLNLEGIPWRIGINDPVVEKKNASPKAIVKLFNKSVATSGNYRNYYIRDGKIYSHTISPFTGYPVRNNLLSASVFTDQCMDADAIATGMMVLGVEKSINIARENNGIDVFLVYYDTVNQEINTYISSDFQSFITE